MWYLNLKPFVYPPRSLTSKPHYTIDLNNNSESKLYRHTVTTLGWCGQWSTARLSKRLLPRLYRQCYSRETLGWESDVSNGCRVGQPVEQVVWLQTLNIQSRAGQIDKICHFLSNLNPLWVFKQREWISLCSEEHQCFENDEMQSKSPSCVEKPHTKKANVFLKLPQIMYCCE